MSKVFKPIQNALLMPLQGDITCFTSGVFDSAGNFVAGSMLDRCHTPAIPSPASTHLKGVFLFGGYLFGHYGHFILESLSRAYAIAQCRPEVPLLFMTTRKEVDTRSQNVFTILGIQNKIILVHEPTQVDTLLFSEAGCGLYPPRILPEQIAALGAVPVAPDKEGKKIWLSRSYLSLLGGTTNEEAMESHIASLGYKIIHPERLSFLEQVHLIASSAIVAGFDGSAFYTSLFAKKVHGRFILCNRRAAIPEEIPILLGAKKIPLELHEFSVENVSGSGPRERVLLKNPQDVYKVLKYA